MTKYWTVPNLSGNLIQVYQFVNPSFLPDTKIELTRPGVNAAVYFSNPSARQQYLFVSYDEFDTAGSSTSHVDVYNVANISSPMVVASLTLTNAVCGMAVQPGTMDLYVATFTDDVVGGMSSTTNPGGVFCFTNSTGYSQASKFQFSSYNDPWNDVADVCANLAFDMDGNLWMSTYTFESSTPGDHFLICYTQVDRQPNSSQNFFKLTNGTQISVAQLAASQSPVDDLLYPLSEPHGIAFDPFGNLWLSNNSDDSNVNGTINGQAGGPINGTLLCLTKKWIDANLLTNATLLGNLTANGFGDTQKISADPGNVRLYGFADGRFGGLTLDGFTLYVSDQSPAGDTFHSVVWILDTSSNAPNLVSTSMATTYPGNTTVAIFNPTPAGLLIRDVTTQTSTQKLSLGTGQVAWESPDIGVSQDPMANTAQVESGTGGTALTSQAITADTNAYVQVRVANVGGRDGSGAPTTGTEVLRVYWAWSSSGLSWQRPWDGEYPTSTGVATGGVVGATALGVIPPGSEQILQIEWKGVPNPTRYGTSGHFCLLARIEGNSLYPFDMEYPELTTANTGQSNILSKNVLDNSKVAWRNIVVNPPKTGHRVRLPVLGANYTSERAHVLFAVQMLDGKGVPTRLADRVRIYPDGPAFDTQLEPFQAGGLRLVDVIRGLEDVILHPHQIFPFEVELELTEDIVDFVVRVIQYVDVQGAEKIVGGQTFVFGKVFGFPTRD